MSEWLMKVIRAEADRLLELAADDEQLRADLRALAERILAATQVTQGPLEPGSGAAASNPLESKATDEPDGRLRELTLGRPRPSASGADPEIGKFSQGHPGGGDRSALEDHCRSKAAAAREVEERQRDVLEGMDSRREW